VLVYPRIEPTDEVFEILAARPGRVGELRPRPRPLTSTAFREYMPEDSARHVDWKATAKIRLG